MENYIEDARQEEKDVPDLLEAIMKGSGLAKEELRLILRKLDQFGCKIQRRRVLTFGSNPDFCDFSLKLYDFERNWL